jgi:hypothetical protein
VEADPELIELVNRHVGGDETRQVVATLITYRRRSDGSMMKVDVRVSDTGVPGRYRWLVEAFGEDGSFATGNGAHDVVMAFAGTHWNQLDQGPD